MMGHPDVEVNIRFHTGGEENKSHDLVQALRGTETCRTSANNKDIDIAVALSVSEVLVWW